MAFIRPSDGNNLVILRSISCTGFGESTERASSGRRDGKNTTKVEIDVDLLAGSRTIKAGGVELRALNSVAFIAVVASTCVPTGRIVRAESVVVAVIEARIGAFINVNTAGVASTCVTGGARSTGATSNHIGALGERVTSSVIDKALIDIVFA